MFDKQNKGEFSQTQKRGHEAGSLKKLSWGVAVSLSQAGSFN
jgi:hypothetical protein